MATGKQLQIWARTVTQWISEIEDATTSERLAQAAAAMERLANYKEPDETTAYLENPSASLCKA